MLRPALFRAVLGEAPIIGKYSRHLCKVHTVAAMEGPTALPMLLWPAHSSMILAEEFDDIIGQEIRLLHGRKMPSCTCMPGAQHAKGGPIAI